MGKLSRGGLMGRNTPGGGFLGEEFYRRLARQAQVASNRT